jgi:prephenate dehydrogenase
VSTDPVIGIVGLAGAYGRWLERFFVKQMGLVVIGRDPAGDRSMDERELVERADVLIFSAPIRHTPALIRRYVQLADGIEEGRLWMDVTSIKSTPVAAMLRSQAEVVGLHPMCAPPKTPTLKARPMAVCAARVERWRPWLDAFVAATQADRVDTDPEQHDRAMALVQGLVHASHMGQAAVWKELAPMLGGGAAIARFATVGYRLDQTVTRRMLSGNPAIYEDIQFENPHVAPMLARLAGRIDDLRKCVRAGNDEAREYVRDTFLTGPASVVGGEALREGSYTFERLGYLLTDLAQPLALSVFLPEDRPGSLRALLSVFEQRGINLDSIHSSRTAEGELHFRIGVAAETDPALLEAAAAAIRIEGIGRVLHGS